MLNRKPIMARAFELAASGLFRYATRFRLRLAFASMPKSAGSFLLLDGQR